MIEIIWAKEYFVVILHIFFWTKEYIFFIDKIKISWKKGFFKVMFVILHIYIYNISKYWNIVLSKGYHGIGILFSNKDVWIF